MIVVTACKDSACRGTLLQRSFTFISLRDFLQTLFFELRKTNDTDLGFALSLVFCLNSIRNLSVSTFVFKNSLDDICLTTATRFKLATYRFGSQ